MKCPNCGKTDFEQMPLYDISFATRGQAEQLVDSYVCMNCGRVELFMPQELIDRRIQQKRQEAERQKAEAERKREGKRLRDRMQELEKFLQDENNTLKQLKEAKKELDEIKTKLGIPLGNICYRGR